MDIQKLVDRAKELIVDPQAAWGKIKAETHTVEGIYKEYLIPLAVAGLIAEFVANTFMASHPFVGGLLVAVFGAAVALAMVYVSAFVLEWLAPKFQCTPPRIETFKFTAFASMTGSVAKILVIVPVVGSIASMLLGLYGIYVAYVGFQPMTGVPDAKKWPLIIVYGICMVVIGIVLAFPITLITAAFLI